MEHRTLKFERNDARRWTFKVLDEKDLPMLVSTKSFKCLDEAVEEIRGLFRMAEEV